VLLIKGWKLNMAFEIVLSGTWLDDFSVEFGRWYGTAVAEDCLSLDWEQLQLLEVSQDLEASSCQK